MKEMSSTAREGPVVHLGRILGLPHALMIDRERPGTKT